MHGRPRQPAGVQENPEKVKASQKRVSDHITLLPKDTTERLLQNVCLTCDECWSLQIALYSKLTTAVLTRRAAKQYDEETLALAGKLLEQNPELYTVWNYRREALQDKLKVSLSGRKDAMSWSSSGGLYKPTCRNLLLQGSDGSEAAMKTARQELQVTQAALIRNPKSYGSWHYRKWITEQRLLPLEEELQLVQQYVTLSPC